MNSYWKSVKLTEIASKKRWAMNGGPFGSKLSRKHYSPDGVPVIRGCNLPAGAKFSFEDFVYVSEEKADELAANNAHPGDLVFTQRGTLGQVGLIPLDSPFPRFVISQSQMKLTVDGDLADPAYLYHVFSSPAVVQSIHNLAFSSGVPHINLDILRNFQVDLPPLPIQRRIADILSAYDDLIENSQRRIKILEEMARRLYREWFVYFRFPGHEDCLLVESPLGEIPEGWEVCNLKDAATVTYGFPFASKKFNTSGIGTPVIRIRDIPAGLSATFTGESAEDRYHVKNGHILVGMDGDFHMCIWSSGHAFQNQRVARFESNGQIGNFHLFLALECPIQEFNKAIVGTTVAHLGDMHIKTIKLVKPPYELQAKARDVLEPMSEQIIDLKRQIQNLRRTRDLLLPRLLSGQIDVEALPEPVLSEP